MSRIDKIKKTGIFYLFNPAAVGDPVYPVLQ